MTTIGPFCASFADWNKSNEPLKKCMGSIWKNALIFSMAKKKVVINLVMAVWRSFLSLCDAACEMKNEAAATAAHETVPVLVALQAVCDVTRMVIHSWFRLAACSSFCLCVCVTVCTERTTVHPPVIRESRARKQRTHSKSRVSSSASQDYHQRKTSEVFGGFSIE